MCCGTSQSLRTTIISVMFVSHGECQCPMKTKCSSLCISVPWKMETWHKLLRTGSIPTSQEMTVKEWSSLPAVCAPFPRLCPWDEGLCFHLHIWTWAQDLLCSYSLTISCKMTECINSFTFGHVVSHVESQKEKKGILCSLAEQKRFNPLRMDWFLSLSRWKGSRHYPPCFLCSSCPCALCWREAVLGQHVASDSLKQNSSS